MNIQEVPVLELSEEGKVACFTELVKPMESLGH